MGYLSKGTVRFDTVRYGKQIRGVTVVNEALVSAVKA